MQQPLSLRVRQLLCVALLVSAGTAVRASAQSATALDDESRELARFEAALEAAIADRGPYSPELAETYQGFGRQLQQRGRHADALAMLRKAQHVARVNHGIHGAGQIPLLRAMIQSYKATGQFAPANAAYEQLLWISAKGLDARDPARIALLREAARWHLSAHLLDEDERRYSHLEAAHQLLVQADALAEQLGADTTTRSALLGDAALGRFYLLRDRGNRRFDPQAPAGYRHGQGEGVAAALQNLTTNFAAGRSLHELRVARLEADTQVLAGERYRAQLELADWYLLFDRNDEAIARYREARAANPAPTGEEPFATPLPLPAARGGTTSALAVRIRLDVSARGHPDNVELLEDSAVSELRPRILRAIREARFRPVFAAGEPMATQGAIISFPLAD